MPTRLHPLLLTLALATGSASAWAAPAPFVDAASQAGAAEVEASKQALTQSESADVKLFATRLIDDHQRANTELKNLAAEQGLTPPDPARLGEQARQTLPERHDRDFDRDFVQRSQQTLERLLQLYQRESNDSDNPELKRFASRNVPVLRQQVQEATELSEKYAGR